MNHLRNHSGIIKDKLKAQAALVKERNNQVQLKLQVKQIKVQSEFLQRQIQTLTIEKSNLQSNKTVLGKLNLQLVFGHMKTYSMLWISTTYCKTVNAFFDISWNRGDLWQMPFRVAPPQNIVLLLFSQWNKLQKELDGEQKTLY